MQYLNYEFILVNLCQIQSIAWWWPLSRAVRPPFPWGASQATYSALLLLHLYTALIEKLLLSSVYLNRHHVWQYMHSYTVNKIQNIFKGSPFRWWTGKCFSNGFDSIFIGCSMLKYFLSGFHDIFMGCCIFWKIQMVFIALHQVVKSHWKYSDLFFHVIFIRRLEFSMKIHGVFTAKLASIDGCCTNWFSYSLGCLVL